MTMNEGARALACVEGSLASIAAKIGSQPTRGMVGKWRSAQALPSDEHRAATESAFGIPRQSWDRPVRDAAGVVASPPDGEDDEDDATDDATPATAVEDLRRTIARIDAQLVRLEGGDANASHLAQLYNAKTGAVAKLARLTGEGEITGAMIVRSRVWRDLLDRLGPILEKHKAAAAEIAAALEEFER